MRVTTFFCISFITLIGIFLSQFCSCIFPLEINGNSYRYLSDKQKARIHPFDIAKCSNCGNSLERGHFMEINNKNLDSILNKKGKVVISFLNSFCSNVSIDQFKGYNNYFSGQNKTINYYLISKSYDLKEMRIMNDVIKTNGVVFVLQDQYYGHKLKKINKKFNKNLDKFDNDDIIKSSTDYFDTYVFDNGKLLYANNSVSVGKINSLLYSR